MPNMMQPGVMPNMMQPAGAIPSLMQPVMIPDMTQSDATSTSPIPTDMYPGTLNVIVHHAKDLIDTQLIGQQNAFVKLQLQGEKIVLKSSTDQSGGKTANWNQQHFPFAIKAHGTKLVVQVCHDRSVKIMSDQLIGGVVIDIDNFIASASAAPLWFVLGRDASMRNQAGAILLSCQYFPLNSGKNEGNYAAFPSGTSASCADSDNHSLLNDNLNENKVPPSAPSEGITGEPETQDTNQVEPNFDALRSGSKKKKKKDEEFDELEARFNALKK